MEGSHGMRTIFVITFSFAFLFSILACGQRIGAPRQPSGRVSPVPTELPPAWQCEATFNKNQPIWATHNDDCRTYELETFVTDDSGSGPLNKDLNIYGQIFFDASDHLCAYTAKEKLKEKLTSDLARDIIYDGDLNLNDVPPFGRWLKGAVVSLVYATAIKLESLEMLDSDLKSLLDQMRDAYVYNEQAFCGVGTEQITNNCLDDISQGAVAYAYMAAYEKRMQRDPTIAASEAKGFIRRFFTASPKSICVFSQETFRCTGSFADLGPYGSSPKNGYEVASFNHGKQNVAYGLGLVTQISGAFWALDDADQSFSSAELKELKKGALMLLDEGQRKAKTDGSDFRSNCYELKSNGGRYDILRDNIYCTDENSNNYGYVPSIYPVRKFFIKYFATVPAPWLKSNDNTTLFAYNFAAFDETRFDVNSLRMHEGRRAIYGYLGHCWHVDPPE
jgi:hypothetical protein